MLKRSFDDRRRERCVDNRVRITIPKQIEDRLQRRMEQDDMRDMSLSAYLSHLIKMDTGAYV